MSENTYIVKNLIKQFIAFLKKNDAYTKYLHNVEKDMDVHFKETKEQVKDFLLRKWLREEAEYSVPNFLAGAFVWSNTAEGHNYWQTLDKRWRKEIIHHTRI